MIYRKNARIFSLAIFAALTVVDFFGLTDFVFAAAADGGGGAATPPANLGDVICNAFANTQPLGTVFSYVAYVAAAFFTVNGIHHLKAHSESRQNNPIKHGLIMLGGAALLFSAPGVVSVLISSLFTTGGSGAISCSAGAVGGGQQLDQMLSGLVTNIQAPMMAFVSIIAIVSGVWMIVSGCIKASKHGVDPKAHSINSIISNMIFGAILISVGTSLDTMLGSLFGSGTTASVDVTTMQSTVTQWQFVSNLGGAGQFANAVGAALTFFQLIGIIAFVRGLLILKKVVEGGGNVTMAQGITHICGGALAVNIAPFIKIMDTTFGTNLM